MKEKTGEVFSIAEDNMPVPGCTISKEIHSGESYIAYYSLAGNTDISAEIYPYHKLIIIAEGQAEVYTADGVKKALGKGDGILAPTNIPVGIRTEESAIYTEIAIRREDAMNEAIKAGEFF